jgi:hypothetical protein
MHFFVGFIILWLVVWAISNACKDVERKEQYARDLQRKDMLEYAEIKVWLESWIAESKAHHKINASEARAKMERVIELALKYDEFETAVRGRQAVAALAMMEQAVARQQVAAGSKVVPSERLPRCRRSLLVNSNPTGSPTFSRGPPNQKTRLG